MSQTAALLLSIVIEAAVAALLMRVWRRGDPARAALATLVTHMAVWNGVLPLADLIGYGPAVLLVEFAVVLAEAPAYRLLVPLGWRDALLASLIANAASTGIGLALYASGLA